MSAVGTAAYLPGEGQGPYSIAQHAAALATHIDDRVCIPYGGNMFWTTGNEEQLLQELLQVPLTTQQRSVPQLHYGMGCVR